jgi:hypothetical protein
MKKKSKILWYSQVSPVRHVFRPWLLPSEMLIELSNILTQEFLLKAANQLVVCPQGWEECQQVLILQ